MATFKRINRAVLTVLLITLTTVSMVWGLSAQQIARKAFPSVVLLVMEDANGQPLSMGSGFFVRPNIVATNLHVVAGASGGYAKPVNQQIKYNIAGTVGIDADTDLVLLRIDNVQGKPLPLEHSVEAQIGDEVYAVGNPLGLEGTFSKGIISGIRQIGSQDVYQITAPISPGSSGGPVLNNQGKVIGVSVAQIKSGQNLNFAIPVSYLHSLLSRTTPVRPLMVRKELLKSGLFERSRIEGVEVRFEGKTLPSGDPLSWGQQERRLWLESILVWHEKQYKLLIPTYVKAALKFRKTYGASSELPKDLIQRGGSLGYIKFSIINNVRESVSDIKWTVVWYDQGEKPSDIQRGITKGPIPGRLAKRVRVKIPDEMWEGWLSLAEVIADERYAIVQDIWKKSLRERTRIKTRVDKLRSHYPMAYVSFDIRIIDYQIGN